LAAGQRSFRRSPSMSARAEALERLGEQTESRGWVGRLEGFTRASNSPVGSSSCRTRFKNEAARRWRTGADVRGLDAQGGATASRKLRLCRPTVTATPSQGFENLSPLAIPEAHTTPLHGGEARSVKSKPEWPFLSWARGKPWPLAGKRGAKAPLEAAWRSLSWSSENIEAGATPAGNRRCRRGGAQCSGGR